MQGHGICESMGGDGMALARPAAMPKRITQNMEETCSLAKKKGKEKRNNPQRVAMAMLVGVATKISVSIMFHLDLGE